MKTLKLFTIIVFLVSSIYAQNVGIGLPVPNHKLDVYQNVSGKYVLHLFHDQDISGNGLLIESNGGDVDDTLLYVRGDLNGSPTDYFIIVGNRRVGINNNNPTASLDINGNLRVRNLPNGAVNDQIVVADASGNIRKRPTRPPAWSTADYDSGWFTMQSQAGTSSFREVTHGFGAYPSKVLVLVRPTSGANAGFIFEGVGAAHQDDDQQWGAYGGVVYAYDQNRVRLWAPDRNNDYSNGSIIFIGDGWGGEVNAQTANTAQVRVLCWR